MNVTTAPCRARTRRRPWHSTAKNSSNCGVAVFDVPPPAIDDNDEFSQAKDPRYADLGAAAPKTECLKDVITRMLPYWDESIVPDLKAGKRVLVTAHGNSLRGIG